MPQTPVLFNGSLFDNIVYNIPGWTPRDVRGLLLRHDIERVFRTSAEDYLQRDVGHLGQHLSGGQKQMVMLARTLVMIAARTQKSADAPWILILDEPTASLDSTNEQRLIRALHHVKARVTIIVITHSEQVVRLCDTHRSLTPLNR
jgi:ABC-type bacteriocin/lantibiotic exporter with double-glycine peptidase domain